MLVLVLFTDNIFLICESSDVNAFKTKCPAVKYLDGKKYTARVLCLHEDRWVLEEIQRNLEKKSSSVSFKYKQLLKDKLLYSAVLKQHKGCPDANKLYLDPTVLPSKPTNSKADVFSFRGRDKGKDFFRVQSPFISFEIISEDGSKEPIINESPIKSTCTSPVPTDQHTSELDTKAIIIDKHQVPEKKTTIGQEFENKIPRTKISTEHTTEIGIHDEKHSTDRKVENIILNEKDLTERDAKNAIHDEKDSATRVIENEILDKKNANKREDEHEINDEKNFANPETDIPIRYEKNSTERKDENASCDNKNSTEHETENKILVKNNSAEQESEIALCSEKTSPECEIRDEKDSIPSDTETKILVKNNSAEQESEIEVCVEKTSPECEIHDEKDSIPCDTETKIEIRDVKVTSKCNAESAVYDKRNFTVCEIKNAMNAERIKTSLLDENCNTFEKMNCQKNVEDIMVKQSDTENEICSNFPADLNKNSEFHANLLTDAMIDVAEVVIQYDLSSTDENANVLTRENELGIPNAMDLDKKKSENEIGDEKGSPDRKIRNETDSIDCETDINIRNKNLILDENSNSFGTDNVTNSIEDMIVGQPDNEEEIRKNLDAILNEGTEYQENLVTEDMFDVEELAFNSNATYTLDLMAIDLPTDPNSFLDRSSIVDTPEKSIQEPKDKPRIVSSVVVPSDTFRRSTNGTYSLRQNSRDLSPIASCSSALASAGPSTSTRYTDNSEDSYSSNGSDGDNYVPSEEELSGSDADIAADEIPNTSIGRKQKQKKNDSSLNISLAANKPGVSAPDDTELTVSVSKAAGGSKKHFCVYCQTLQTKIARHLELAHKDEDDVKKFAALPPKTAERMQIIATIRKNGNYIYNTDRRFNKGDLLVVRRPQEKMKRTAQDFVACGNCKGQYSKAVIRHHFRKCTNKGSSKERLVMVKGRKISARIHDKATEMVRTHVFPYMREDAVVRAIRYDHLLTLFANKQCERYGKHHHLFQMIRARLRLLGRFLLAIKERNNAVHEFADVFQPRHYDDAVASVRIVSGFNETKRDFAHPAVASNLGTLLKQLGEILRAQYIKEERVHDQKRVENFLKLQSEDFGTSVNRAVLETQLQNNRRKQVVLPSMDDITKLHNFLKVQRDKHFEKLKKKFSEDSWRALAEVTLISLQVFNRRRAGEIERVYLEDFDAYQGIDQTANKDAYAALSKEGQALARKYVRFMIRGKRGRGVPVLVPSNLLDSLLLIRKFRGNAGVPESNPYVFGLPSRDKDCLKYLRACILLRQFSEQCGADVPSALRGTQLRKHVATKCISLNLSENQVSDLANFMGHADKIHKDIYRQPVMQNDITKISQLLEIAQGTQDSTTNNDESSSEEEDDNARFVHEAEDDSDETEANERVGNRSKTKKKSSSTNESRSSSRSATRRLSTHRRWTDEERDTVLAAFRTTVLQGKMPTGEEMQKLIDRNDCLRGRQVAQLRTWLHSQKKKGL